MGIIKIKEIEFNQDSRGWFITPISNGDMKSGNIIDIHMVSMEPGTIRGNHYHEHKTENILIIGSTCRVIAVDNNTKKREEKIIENNCKVLLVILPEVTHAVENIGSEVAYLLCYSNVKEESQNIDVVRNKII